VKVQVADTGVGIAPRQLRRIDEAFYQAPSGAAATAEGTGLGLTIARHLIEMHGGELTIHSTPGEGSVFTFVIPTGPLAGVRMLPGTPADPADTDRCALADAPGPLGRLRILVAEDSPDNRRLIAAVLRKAGARVQFAENGASAVRMASENPFDLILMDIEMPGMDGKEAAAALRRKGATVPIIALTATNASPPDAPTTSPSPSTAPSSSRPSPGTPNATAGRRKGNKSNQPRRTQRTRREEEEEEEEEQTASINRRGRGCRGKRKQHSNKLLFFFSSLRPPRPLRLICFASSSPPRFTHRGGGLRGRPGPGRRSL